MGSGSKRRVVLGAIGIIVLLCLVASAVSAYSNRNLPAPPQTQERLEAQDKARIAEAIHLRDQLGEAMWAGFGKQEIPLIVFNETYAFLIGYPDLPEEWEIVQSDEFYGEPYYRRAADDSQNFAVKVGQHSGQGACRSSGDLTARSWAASETCCRPRSSRSSRTDW